MPPGLLLKAPGVPLVVLFWMLNWYGSGVSTEPGGILSFHNLKLALESPVVP